MAIKLNGTDGLFEQSYTMCINCGHVTAWRMQTFGVYYLDEISICCEKPDNRFVDKNLNLL